MDGKIKDCSNAGCEYFCCDFQQGNYIITFPNELESSDLPHSHLRVIDNDYHGGKKVVCEAKDKSNCDGGHKPIDCKMYPLYIKGDGQFIKGTKCPMSMVLIENHKQVAQALLGQYHMENPEVDLKSFLDEVEMFGYEQMD